MPDAAEPGVIRASELSELCSHLQGYAEREKAELARRLHDELGGLLTAAKMDLSWLQSHTEDATFRPRLSQLGNVLDEAMDLKRRVVDELRPSLLDHFGLPTALRAHVQSACGKAGIECEVLMEDEMQSIPREMAIGLFRVMQEGLDNILQHAGAKKVRIQLAHDPDRYLLSLVDDGCGMDVSQFASRGHGLKTMRHRVEAMMGGVLTLDSGPQKGTTLLISVPRAR